MGWHQRVRFFGASAAIFGMLTTTAFAKAPQAPAGKLPCQCAQPTQACLNPMPKTSESFGLKFDVRDVRLYRAYSENNLRFAEFQACVVANSAKVKDVTVRAMLVDRQGRNFATTNGKTYGNLSASVDPLTGAPAVVASFDGRTQTPVTDAQWLNRSEKIIIVVDWTEQDGTIKHQDSFYVPYSPPPGTPES